MQTFLPKGVEGGILTMEKRNLSSYEHCRCAREALVHYWTLASSVTLKVDDGRTKVGGMKNLMVDDGNIKVALEMFL